MSEREWQDAVLRDLGARADEPSTPDTTAVYRGRASLPQPADAAPPAAPPPPVAQFLPPSTPPPPPAAPPRFTPPPVTAPPPAAAPPPVAQAPPPVPQAPPDDSLSTPPLRGDSPGRRASRAFGRVFGLRVAPQTREHAELVAGVQAPVTTCRRIAVIGMRGGCGKSSVAALMALTYAAHRRDAVLAIDGDAPAGSLDLRLDSPTRDVPPWPSGMRPPGQFDAVQPYLGRTAGGVWALRGPGDPLGALNALNRFFAVTVVDRGTQPVRVHDPRLLSTWHAIVFVTGATVDGVASARDALAAMAGWAPPGVLARAVVVLSELNPHPGVDVERAAAALSTPRRPALLLPYDRHLAGGGPIHPALLAESSTLAARRIAAWTLAQALTA